MLRPGPQVKVAVRAVDGDGNWSRWVESETVQARIIDSASQSIALDGTWRMRSLPDTIGHSVESSIQAGSSATLDVQAIAIGVVATEGRMRGTIGISMDGGAGASIDLRSGTRQWRHVVFAHTWQTSAPHHLVLTVDGTPPRIRVDLDAVLVLQVVPAAP
jgi:hypothetical protein